MALLEVRLVSGPQRNRFPGSNGGKPNVRVNMGLNRELSCQQAGDAKWSVLWGHRILSFVLLSFQRIMVLAMDIGRGKIA